MHAEEAVKSVEQIEHDEFIWADETFRGPDIGHALTLEQFSKRDSEIQHHQFPGRIFNSECKFIFVVIFLLLIEIFLSIYSTTTSKT